MCTHINLSEPDPFETIATAEFKLLAATLYKSKAFLKPFFFLWLALEPVFKPHKNITLVYFYSFSIN